MSFTKPMVTIELEEYNQLKKETPSLDIDAETLAEIYSYIVFKNQSHHFVGGGDLEAVINETEHVFDVKIGISKNPNLRTPVLFITKR